MCRCRRRLACWRRGRRGDGGLTRRGRGCLRLAAAGDQHQGDDRERRTKYDCVFHDVNCFFTRQFGTSPIVRCIRVEDSYVSILARCFLSSLRLRLDSRILRFSAAGRGDLLRRAFSRSAISAARRAS